MTTKSSRPQNLDAKITTLQQRAEMALTPISQLARAIADAIGIESDGSKVLTVTEQTSETDKDNSQIHIGVKYDKERIEEKLEEKYDWKVDEIGDWVRARIHFDNQSQILALRSLLGSEKAPTAFRKRWVDGDKGIKVLGASDYFWKPLPHGYIAYHIQLEFTLKGGKVKGEIQVQHTNMRETDRLSHRTYKTKRKKKAQKAKGPWTERDELALESFDESLRRQFEGDIIELNLDGLLDPQLLRPGSKYLQQNPRLNKLLHGDSPGPVKRTSHARTGTALKAGAGQTHSRSESKPASGLRA